MYNDTITILSYTFIQTLLQVTILITNLLLHTAILYIQRYFIHDYIFIRSDTLTRYDGHKARGEFGLHLELDSYYIVFVSFGNE